jgi:hypothetical protein
VDHWRISVDSIITSDTAATARRPRRLCKARRPDSALRAKQRAALRVFVRSVSEASGLTPAEIAFVDRLRPMAETEGAKLPSAEQRAMIEAIRAKMALDTPERAIKRDALRAFLHLAADDPSLDEAERAVAVSMQRYVVQNSGPMPSGTNYTVIGQLRAKLLRGFVRFATGDEALSAFEANFVNGIKQLAAIENGPLPSPKRCAIIAQIQQKLLQADAARQSEADPDADPDTVDDDPAASEDWDDPLVWDRLMQIEAEWTDGVAHD